MACERTVVGPEGGPEASSAPAAAAAGGPSQAEGSKGGGECPRTPRKGAPPTSRLDFWLRRPCGEHYIEVKSCHMVYPDGHGYFPDSISQRASRHVAELASLVARGHRATALFVVGRGDLQGCVR